MKSGFVFTFGDISGHYVIIPSTYDADRECEFMLRIFTEEAIDPK